MSTTSTDANSNANSNKQKEKRPILASVCGVYLKNEMQSVYRQIYGVKNFRNIVLAERLQNLPNFYHEDIEQLYKYPYPRAKGNFILRFWYKYCLRKWPPPRPINKMPAEFYPYNLHEVLTRRKVDIAHIYYGHKAVKYHEMLRKWGGKWVVSFHGVDVAKFMDEDRYPEKMRAMLADAALVMARSKSLLAEVAKLGCPSEKLRLNYTPVPMDEIICKVVAKPSDDSWRILQACRLIPKKGILTALEAIKIVTEKLPNLRYLIAGDGAQKSEIKAHIKKLELSKNVELLGWTTQERLRELFADCHLFLHPSEKTSVNDQEGIPNSLVEAMAAGLPTIATNHGGIPEAVKNDVNGLLVPEKNPQALANAILSTFAKEEKLRAFSKNAAKSARAKFSLQSRVAALEEIYHEAMNV